MLDPRIDSVKNLRAYVFFGPPQDTPQDTKWQKKELERNKIPIKILRPNLNRHRDT